MIYFVHRYSKIQYTHCGWNLTLLWKFASQNSFWFNCYSCCCTQRHRKIKIKPTKILKLKQTKTTIYISLAYPSSYTAHNEIKSNLTDLHNITEILPETLNIQAESQLCYLPSCMIQYCVTQECAASKIKNRNVNYHTEEPNYVWLMYRCFDFKQITLIRTVIKLRMFLKKPLEIQMPNRTDLKTDKQCTMQCYKSDICL